LQTYSVSPHLNEQRQTSFPHTQKINLQRNKAGSTTHPKTKLVTV